MSLQSDELSNLFNTSYGYGYYDYTDFPSSAAAPCRIDSTSAIFKYFVAFVYVVVCLLSLVGNSLVVLVVTYNKGSRSVTDMYLLHLAIADLLFALTLPFWAIYRAHEWIFGNVMCKATSVLKEVNFYSGVLLLAFISIDRYLAIVYATRAVTEKRHWVKFLCFGIWLFSFLISFPMVVFRNAFRDNSSSVVVCYENIQGGKTSEWRVILRILPQVFGFIIPLIIMLLCYSVTVHRLLQTKNSQKTKAMKVIIAVVLVFLLCWLPYNISILADTLMRVGIIADTCDRRKSIDLALSSTEILGFAHSCINPIIYAFIGQKFRNNFLKFLVARGIISKTVMLRYRKGSASSTSGITSTTL
ncbi:PREDICTED: C-X-C chemokine receptor type 1 [Gekko japonicus]|uniref:C-X-C chemokine receptor type 2 n=1 Tax=Gekko japonicus TaxID=146911 RepID=A0ABM1JVM3_GEKJA|nr:PREDICTED: C-X-C chemokine receptor type 1 [Gekko japonicus]